MPPLASFLLAFLIRLLSSPSSQHYACPRSGRLESLSDFASPLKKAFTRFQAACPYGSDCDWMVLAVAWTICQTRVCQSTTLTSSASALLNTRQVSQQLVYYDFLRAPSGYVSKPTWNTKTSVGSNLHRQQARQCVALASPPPAWTHCIYSHVLT